MGFRIVSESERDSLYGYQNEEAPTPREAAPQRMAGLQRASQDATPSSTSGRFRVVSEDEREALYGKSSGQSVEEEVPEPQNDAPSRGIISETLNALGGAATDEMPMAVAQMIEGGDVPASDEETWTGRFIAEQRQDIAKRVQSKEYLEGKTTNKAIVEGIQSGAASIPLGIAGFGAGLGVAAITPADPVTKTVAGSIAAGIVSGAAMIPMAKSEFIRNVRDALIQKNGPLDKDEWEQIKGEINTQANEFAAWEAGTEGISEGISYLIFKAPVGKWLTKTLGTGTTSKILNNTLTRIGAKYTGMVAAEAPTEALAKQQQDLLLADQDVIPQPEGTQIEQYGRALKEVTPPTMVATGLLGAGFKGMDVAAKRMGLQKKMPAKDEVPPPPNDLFEDEEASTPTQAPQPQPAPTEAMPEEIAQPLERGAQKMQGIMGAIPRPPLTPGFQGPVQVNPRSGGWEYQETPATQPQAEVQPSREVIVEPPQPGPAEKSAQVFERQMSGEERLRQSRKGADLLARQLREQEEIVTPQEEILKAAIEDVKAGAPGTRVRIEAPEYGPGQAEYKGQPSTYPEWMKGNGWTKEDVLDALDRKLNDGAIGKHGRLLPVTEQQQTIIDAANDYYQDQVARAKSNDEYQSYLRELADDTDIQSGEIEEAERAGKEEGITSFAATIQAEVSPETGEIIDDDFNWGQGAWASPEAEAKAKRTTGVERSKFGAIADVEQTPTEEMKQFGFGKRGERAKQFAQAEGDIEPAPKKAQPGQAAGELTEDTQINGITFAQLEDIILKDKPGIKKELESIKAEHGREGMQDLVNPGKLYARLRRRLVQEQGMSKERAVDVLQGPFERYEQRFKEVEGQVEEIPEKGGVENVPEMRREEGQRRTEGEVISQPTDNQFPTVAPEPQAASEPGGVKEITSPLTDKEALRQKNLAKREAVTAAREKKKAEGVKTVEAEEKPISGYYPLEEKKKAYAIKKLRIVAERTKTAAEEKYNQDRNENTGRRARMANNAKADAAHDIAIAETMLKIADGLDKGEITALKGLTAKAQVEHLNKLLVQAQRSKYKNYVDQKEHAGEKATEQDARRAEYPEIRLHPSLQSGVINEVRRVRGGGKIADNIRGSSIDFDTAKELLDFAKKHNITLPWTIESDYKEIASIRRMGITNTDELQKALAELVGLRSEKRQEDPVKALERELIHSTIPGFFPTPKAVVSDMLDQADIQDGMKVLEPSAGKGDIADAIKEQHPGVDVSVVEKQYTLQNILKAKGYDIADSDFMEHEGKYDRIIMNPPFEKGQDIDHVMHAYSLLNPGGRIVAIMSEGTFFRNDSKASKFREFLDDVNGTSEKLPEKSFQTKEAIRQTGVAARMVVIDKAGAEKVTTPSHTAEKAKKGPETKLNIKEDVSPLSLEAFQKRWEDKGVDVYLYEYSKDKKDIKLDNLVVPKDLRKQGVGSKFMEELTEWADSNDKRIILTLGQKDDALGTTSSTRLKKFYGRFGFVKNFGRNKDYRISASMYRRPSADTKLAFGTITLNNQTFRDNRQAIGQFRKWMRTAGIPKALLDALDVEVKDAIKIIGNVRRSEVEHNKKLSELQKAIGSTTFFDDASVLVQFASDMSFFNAEDTAYHEAFHVILNKLVSEENRTALLDHYKGNEEDAAKAFSKFVMNEETTDTPKFIRKIFYQIKRILTKIGNAFRQSQYKTPEDFFRAIYFGADLKGKSDKNTGDFDPNSPDIRLQVEEKPTPRIDYIGDMEDADGKPFGLYNVFGVEGVKDGSTVTENTLKRLGLIPEKAKGETKLNLMGELIFQSETKTFIGDNGNEYQGSDASKFLSLIEDLEFKNITGFSKKGFERKGGSIYFIPGNESVANSIHEISGEIVLSDKLKDNKTELRKKLIHELTHWGQIQRGETPKAYYTSPEESIRDFMEYLSDPAEVKARFNEEGKSDQEYEDFMEKLDWAKGDDITELKNVDIGEIKIEDQKSWRMPVSYINQELEVAKKGRDRDYLLYYPSGSRPLLQRDIKELENIVNTTSPGKEVATKEGIYNKLDTIQNRTPLSDTNISNINALLSSIKSKWTSRRLQFGDRRLRSDEIEYYNKSVMRVEINGKIDSKTGKRKNINPIIVEGLLRDKAGIRGVAVAPNEIDIDLEGSNLDNLKKLQKTIIKAKQTLALPTPSVIPETKLNIAESAKEFHDDMNTFMGDAIDFVKGVPETVRTRAATKAGMKVDSTAFDRYVKTPFHYFRKVPAAWRMFQDALSRSDNYWLKIDELSKAPDGQYYTLKINNAKKQNPEEYKKIQGFFKHRDQNAIGSKVVKKKKEDKYVLYGLPKGSKRRRVKQGEFATESEAWEQAIQNDLAFLRKKGVSEQGLDAAEATMRIRHTGFDMLARNIREVIAKYEELGMDLPKYSIWHNGEKIQVDLKLELARMGDIRGYYMPRSWTPGGIVLYAKKKGVHPRIEKFDILGFASNRKRDMVANEGYRAEDIEIKKSGRMPEDVFDMAGKTIAVNAMLNEALTRLKKKDFKLSDFDLEGRVVDGPGKNKDFMLIGATNKRQNQILKDKGGKWYRGSETEIERWHFTNKPPGFEKRLAKSLAMAEVATTVDQETAMLFAGGLAEQIGNVIKERGSRKHMIRRNDARGLDVWEGYEEDLDIAMSQYVRSLAAGEAKHVMAVNMVKHLTGTDIPWSEFKAIREEETGEAPEYDDYLDFVSARRIDPAQQENIFKDATTYMKDVLRNQETADRVIGVIRGLAVLKYLGLKISALPVNMSAMATTVPATMKAYAGIDINKAFGHLTRMSKAYIQYERYKKTQAPGLLSQEHIDLFAEMEKKGWGKPQFNREAISTLENKASKGYSWLIEKAMVPFAITETFNRMVTISATYEGLRKAGKDHAEALEAAKDVSDYAHAVYGKANYPHLMRGENIAAQALKMGYIFKQFTHNYLQTMWDMGWNKRDAKATLWMAASPMFLGGAGAFAGTAIFNSILKALGADDPEEWFYSQVEENFGEKAGIVARVGAPGLFGVSLKGSLALHLTEPPTTIPEVLGAPASVIGDIWEGGRHIARGEISKGLERLAPAALAGSIKAVREATEGVTTRSNLPVYYGKKPLVADTGNAIVRFMGFSPAKIAIAREKQWNEKQVEQKYTKRRSAIYAKFHQLYLQPASERTKAKYIDLLSEVKEYNDNLIESGLVKKGYSPITQKLLRMNIKRGFQPSKRERLRDAE